MNDFCFYRNGQYITFNSFCQSVFLVRQEVRKVTGAKVLLFDADSYQFAIWLFALILEERHVLLPPNSQIGTLTQLAEECDVTAGSAAIAGKLQIPFVTEDLAKHYDALTSAPSFNRDQLFKLFIGEITFYTSGTTGQAKAVNKSCQQLLLEVSTLKNEFSRFFNHNNIIISTVSHQHIYGLLFKLLVPLRLGLIVINQTFEYPEHISRLLVELLKKDKLAQKSQSKINGVTLISSPAHLQRLALDNVLMRHAKDIGAIFSSGGLLSYETSQVLLRQMKRSPIEVYGSTETGGIAWRNGQHSKDEPWQVFPDINIQVSFDNQRLEIFSPFVEQQPYLTDDKIELLSSQRFLLKGRVDRTVKIEEKRVNLTQIEQILVNHSWIFDAKIIVINNNSSNTRKVLASIIILTESGRTFLLKQGKLSLNNVLKQHLLNDVERICLPKKWRYIDQYPYNSQGKLVLNNLEKLFE